MMVVVLNLHSCSRAKKKVANRTTGEIGYTSVTERNDPALAPFEGLTKAPGVFTRLGSLGMGRNHRVKP